MDAMKITIHIEGIIAPDQTITIRGPIQITPRDAAKRLGRMTSQLKATTARENGLKGGRPRGS